MKKMSQVQGMTYAEASRIARRTGFGSELPAEVAAVLRAKVQRQAARYDMTLGEKSVRRMELQKRTGIRRDRLAELQPVPRWAVG